MLRLHGRTDHRTAAGLRWRLTFRYSCNGGAGRNILRNVLSHPLTRGIDLDDPRTTALRREIIQSKPFLRKIYHEWYELLARDLPVGEGRVLELGSGAGFLPQILPEVITSEFFVCPGIDVVLDGLRMPLADQSLRAIVMTDVFHHLPDVRQFFARRRGRSEPAASSR